MKNGENLEYLNYILKEEKRYTGVSHEGVTNGVGHEILVGQNKVLVSAMVGVKHNEIKKGENIAKSAHIYTALLASLLHKDMDVYSIIKTLHTESDLTDGVNTSYKQDIIDTIVERKISFFMDLRGGIKNQKSGVIIGDGELEYIYGNTEFRDETKALFEKYGIRCKFSPTYQAKKSDTLANYVFTHTGVPSVQLLINPALRSPKQEIESFLRLESALNEYVALCLKYFKETEYIKK